jgi:hypothetical protein
VWFDDGHATKAQHQDMARAGGGLTAVGIRAPGYSNSREQALGGWSSKRSLPHCGRGRVTRCQRERARIGMKDRPTLTMSSLLQCRDVSLGLSSTAFPLSRIWPEMMHPQSLLTMINYWQAEGEMDFPWHSDPEISEGGKTKAEMVWSLMNEPIRKPIGLAIVLCVGFAFLDGGTGNNRLSAAMLRGLTTIPATATAVRLARGVE